MLYLDMLGHCKHRFMECAEGGIKCWWILAPTPNLSWNILVYNIPCMSHGTHSSMVFHISIQNYRFSTTWLFTFVFWVIQNTEQLLYFYDTYACSYRLACHLSYYCAVMFIHNFEYMYSCYLHASSWMLHDKQTLSWGVSPWFCVGEECSLIIDLDTIVLP